MSMSQRKLLPLVIWAMLGLVVLGSKPAHAQLLAATITPSSSGYFYCLQTGYWIDSGLPYDTEIWVDGNLVDLIYYAPFTGMAYANLAGNVGALASGSYPMSPSYVPLTGTHSCEIKDTSPAGTILDTGLVWHTF